MRHLRQPKWSRHDNGGPIVAEALRPGWYGLQAIGDGWRPVTSPESSLTLIIADVVATTAATHFGYWNGKKWDFVERIELKGDES